MSSERDSELGSRVPSPDISVVVIDLGGADPSLTWAALDDQRLDGIEVERVTARLWPGGHDVGSAPPSVPGVVSVDVAGASPVAAANTGLAVARAQSLLLLLAGDVPDHPDLLRDHVEQRRAGSAVVLGSVRRDAPGPDPVRDGWVGHWPTGAAAPTRHLCMGAVELQTAGGFDERLPDLTVAVLDLVERIGAGAGQIVQRPDLGVREPPISPRAARERAAAAGRSAQALELLRRDRGAASRRIGPRLARVTLRWSEPALAPGVGGAGGQRLARFAVRAAFARGGGQYPLLDGEVGRGGLLPPPGGDRPAVSVVVPFAGDAAAAEKLVDALSLLQRGSRDEVFVVDNSRTPVVAPRMGIEVLRADAEWSSYHARNVGWRETSAPWVLFLDSDCLPAPWILDVFFAPRPDPAEGAVAGAVLNPASHRGWIARWSAQVDVLSQVRTLSRPELPFAVTANLLVRRECLEELGGFVEGIRGGGDAELCWRLAEAGRSIGYRPRAAVVHRHRTNAAGLLRQYHRYGGSVAWLSRRRGFTEADWLRPNRALAVEWIADLMAGRFELAATRLTTLATQVAAQRGARGDNRPPGAG